MSHEIAKRQVSIAHLRRCKTSTADQRIASAKAEAEALKAQLMEAELEGTGWNWWFFQEQNRAGQKNGKT